MTRRFPFPIPRGWYQVAYSDEICPGAPERLRYFERDLLVGRNDSGTAFVVDADAQEASPDALGADPGRWVVVERNGMLLAWFDPESGAPQWQVEPLEEYGSPGWSPYWRHRMQVRTCNQEILENVADRAHFHFVHGTVDVPTTLLTMEGTTLRAEQITRLRTPQGIVDGGIVSRYRGLGLGTARFTGICEALLVLATTPIERDYLDVRFSLTIDQSRGASTERGVGKAIISDIIQQFVEDTPIWENKQYKPRPILCDGDGEIARYRTWAAQFY